MNKLANVHDLRIDARRLLQKSVAWLAFARLHDGADHNANDKDE